jgi:hypothetical protein
MISETLRRLPGLHVTCAIKTKKLLGKKKKKTNTKIKI